MHECNMAKRYSPRRTYKKKSTFSKPKSKRLSSAWNKKKSTTRKKKKSIFSWLD